MYRCHRCGATTQHDHEGNGCHACGVGSMSFVPGPVGPATIPWPPERDGDDLESPEDES